MNAQEVRYPRLFGFIKRISAPESVTLRLIFFSTTEGGRAGYEIILIFIRFRHLLCRILETHNSSTYFGNVRFRHDKVSE